MITLPQPFMRRRFAPSGGGGTPDLLDEGFEGAGTPSGWVNGGSANFDYSATPLSGSQSLRIPTGTLAYYDTGGSINHSEVWFSILFKAETITGDGAFTVEIFDSGYTPLYTVNLFSGGTLGLGGVPGNTADALSAGTIYQIWGHYKKGTGADGIWEVSFDTPGNPRPNSGNKFHGVSNGNSTANAAGIAFRTDLGGSHVYVFDNAQVSSTDIW